MEKATRMMLKARVDLLNKILNRPATAWTKLPPVPLSRTGYELESNEGHFMLSTWSPGDGWTRYTLSQIVGKKGGEITVSPVCNAHEMWAYLRGVFDAIDSFCYADGGKNTFDKWPSAVTVPLSNESFERQSVTIRKGRKMRTVDKHPNAR